MALKFITFEGGEGTGKSTQAKLLAERLRVLGFETVLTREPGGTPLGEAIRALILAQKPQSGDAEFLLFAAARAEHIAAVIEPALNQGAFVVCDRYIHSTRVYQGDLGSVDEGLIDVVERSSVAPHFPALSFVMDLPPEVGLARAAQRGAMNRYDNKDLAWHRQLREAFLYEAKVDPRCRIIDAARAETVVADDIWVHVSATFALKAP